MTCVPLPDATKIQHLQLFFDPSCEDILAQQSDQVNLHGAAGILILVGMPKPTALLSLPKSLTVEPSPCTL